MSNDIEQRERDGLRFERGKVVFGACVETESMRADDGFERYYLS